MGDVNLLPLGKIATGCVKNGVTGDALELALGVVEACVVSAVFEVVPEGLLLSGGCHSGRRR